MIVIISLVTQTLKLPTLQEIITDADFNNMGENRTLQKNSSNGVDGTTPVHSGISETSTPDPSDISGTRINGTFVPPCIISGTSVISGTSAAPPYGGIWIPRIGNKRQFTSPNFRNSNELNADADRNFANDTIAPIVSTQLFCEKFSDSLRKDIYTRCRLNIATESANTMAPQFINRGLSVADALNKSARIWIPATRIIRSPDFTHWSMVDHTVGQVSAVGDAVVNKSD